MKPDLLIPDLFKAEDFEDVKNAIRLSGTGVDKFCARLANAHFREWAKSLTEVGRHGNLWNERLSKFDTHVALLAFPQELKPKECKHEIIEYTVSGSQPVTRGKCAKCGAKLKAVEGKNGR